MTRLALIRALLLRELGTPAIALIAAGALAGIWAGGAAIDMLDGPLTGVLEDAIARFHTTVLWVAAFLVILRISVRGQDDHSNGWLVPYIAAGGFRWFHSIAVAAVTAMSMWLLFVAGAGSFALTLDVVGDSNDVLRFMPRLMLSGGVSLLAFAMLTTVISLTVRDAIATLVLTFVVIGLPPLMYMNAALRGTDVAPWIELLLRLSPGVYVPGTTASWLVKIGFAVVAMAAASALGHLRTARYA
ncbi:hypothetical protein BH23GEM10_BH23GEM10_05380 [soil metagenome]